MSMAPRPTAAFPCRAARHSWYPRSPWDKKNVSDAYHENHKPCPAPFECSDQHQISPSYLPDFQPRQSRSTAEFERLLLRGELGITKSSTLISCRRYHGKKMEWKKINSLQGELV
jgi:hypothetical protein